MYRIQMYAQLASDAAYEQVRYAVVLNESYQKPAGVTSPAELFHSSAILLERTDTAL